MTRMTAVGLALLASAPAYAVDVSVGAALAGNLRISNPGGGDAEFVNPVASNTSSTGMGLGLTVPVRIHLNELATVRLSTHVHYTQAPVGYQFQGNNYRYFGSGLLLGEAVGGEMALTASDGPTPYLFGELGGGVLALWPRTSPSDDATRDFELCELRGIAPETCAAEFDPSNEIRTVAGTGLINLGFGLSAADVLRVELGYLRGSLPAETKVNKGSDGVVLLETAYQAVQLSVGFALGG